VERHLSPDKGGWLVLTELSSSITTLVVGEQLSGRKGGRDTYLRLGQIRKDGDVERHQEGGFGLGERKTVKVMRLTLHRRRRGICLQRSLRGSRQRREEVRNTGFVTKSATVCPVQGGGEIMNVEKMTSGRVLAQEGKS